MQYRILGKTLLEVGIIGLGTEQLENSSKDNIVRVVHKAIDLGVNYIDLMMISPFTKDSMGIALKNKRNNIFLTAHLGALYQNGQYYKSRERNKCEDAFTDFLRRLKTDYIDILILHFIDEESDYQEVFTHEGSLGLALELKRKGQARFIGLSSHRSSSALKAINSDVIDMLMFPVNPVFDLLPDMDVDRFWEEETYRELLDSCPANPGSDRKRVGLECEKHNIGLVAMKPFAGGLLLQKNNPTLINLTPIKCLNYSLSQPGICTVVPGCKTVYQVKENLDFFNASIEEKDYFSIYSNPLWKYKQHCVYCNHCLPCPALIDIGQVTRSVDVAKYNFSKNVSEEYSKLPVKASACTGCKICMERCPFHVDIIKNIKDAISTFGC